MLPEVTKITPYFMEKAPPPTYLPTGREVDGGI